MATPFLGEITIVGFDFAPHGYALCDGQLLLIDQYEALYSLLGTTYGGDGQTTFALPDLRGRSPLHFGDGKGLTPNPLGAQGGEENHTLHINEIPPHTHNVIAQQGVATLSTVENNELALTAAGDIYNTPKNLQNMSAASVTNTGNNEGHSNMQPYLTINFCIALTGTYPPRN